MLNDIMVNANMTVENYYSDLDTEKRHQAFEKAICDYYWEHVEESVSGFDDDKAIQMIAEKFNVEFNWWHLKEICMKDWDASL